MYTQEKEKDAKGGLSGTNWCEFMYLLCRFAMIESSYHNMAFTGKSFLKKEVNTTHTYACMSEYMLLLFPSHCSPPMGY